MLIYTEYGVFGDFRSLLMYMKDERKTSVFISSCNYYGLEGIIFKNGTTFSIDEIHEIITAA